MTASLSCQVHDYWDLLAGGADTMPDVEVNYYDLAFLLYTSGTTGPSKGNMEPHAMMVRGSVDHVEYFGYQPDDVLYTCLPLFHGNALNTCAVPAFLADATLVVSRRFSARAFWDEVRREGVTQFNLLGAMANIIRSQPASPHDRDNKVRQCMMVPVPDFAAEFEERFGLKITSVYALTDFGGVTLPQSQPSAGQVEVGGAAARGRHARHSRRSRSCGADRHARRDLRPQRDSLDGGPRVLQDAGGHRRIAPQSLVPYRRPRHVRQGRLPVLRRSQEGCDPRRGENISSYEIEQILLRHPAVEGRRGIRRQLRDE